MPQRAQSLTESARKAIDAHERRIAFRPREIAEMLGCSKSLVYERLARGELVGRKLGASTLVTKDELLRWINSLPTCGPAYNRT